MTGKAATLADKAAALTSISAEGGASTSGGGIHIEVDASWSRSLLKMADELIGISKATETEFLELGASLQDFSFACIENSSMAGNLVNAIESGSGFNVHSLKELFETVYSEIDTSSKLILEGSREMNLIINDLNKVLEMEEFFKKLSKTISIIGTLIRIETARVGNAEFNIMTDLVDTLARQILKGTDEIISSVRTANTSVVNVNEQLAPFIETADRELDSVKSRVNIILGELDAMSTQAKWLCERISNRAYSISPEVGEVVASIQFHDITRQQIEHVSEAFHEIEAKIGTFDSEDENGKFVLIRWVSEVIKIQIGQLNFVLNETQKAAVTISGSLSKVSELSEAQAEDAITITAEEESGNNKITLVGTALDALVKVLVAVNDMTVNLLESIKLTSTNLQGMTGQVANVESISENMNLLAMNAMIKVSRVGAAGRALGVLANEISNLSENANIRISDCAGLINSILKRSAQIKTYLSEQLLSRLETSKTVAVQTRQAIETVMEQDKEVISSMNKISASAAQLKVDIENVIKKINFSNIIQCTVTEVIAELERILGDVMATIPGHIHDDVNYAPDLKEMLSRYTMQSERNIHTGAAASEDGDSLLWGESCAKPDDGAGDNFELF
ncbi:methyl-accepting chemotaxis protein [Candidatus Magnetominusculus dajiuhuensis]|uniref:methyl-accepting chemotaxis protein n=1 Tax=Candidatus Magnetominusculus dajiuhuensis TaxID=3137712 RepID=UPI003B42B2B6